MKRLIIAILLIIIPAISSAALPIGEIQSAFIRAHPNHYIWLIELSQILPMRKLQKPVNPGKYADSTQKLTYSWEKMICHQKNKAIDNLNFAWSHPFEFFDSRLVYLHAYIVHQQFLADHPQMYRWVVKHSNYNVEVEDCAPYKGVSSPADCIPVRMAAAKNARDWYRNAENVIPISALVNIFGREISTQMNNVWHNNNFSSTLSCIVQISLSPHGRIVGQPVMIRSSGNPHFDRTTIAAIEKAAPFTPPPGLPYSKYKTVNIDFAH